MSSCPGYTLEAYLSWNYNLIVEGEEESNFSVGAAEHFGLVQHRRPILTQDEFKFIVDLFEPARQVVTDKLVDFDEDEHGSWRTYGAYVLNSFYSDKEIIELDEKVFKYLISIGKKNKA